MRPVIRPRHTNFLARRATGDLARPLHTRLAIGRNFSLLSGDYATALAFLAQGGHGVVSVGRAGFQEERPIKRRQYFVDALRLPAGPSYATRWLKPGSWTTSIPRRLPSTGPEATIILRFE